MKPGTVPVDLKTKKHVKAYLLNNFGERPFIESTHIFHNFMILCLSHQLTYRNDEVPEYPELMKIYITKKDYELYGCWMNPRQMQLFNGHVDFYMKSIMCVFIDVYLEYYPGSQLNKGIQHALQKMKITDEDWDTESITKYYYRYRNRTGGTLLYRKNKKTFPFLSDLPNAQASL